MWTIFKVYLFLMLLLFYILFFGSEAYGDRYPARDGKPAPLLWKVIISTGSPGKFPNIAFKIYNGLYKWFKR